MTAAPPGFRGPFHTDQPTRARYSEGAGPFQITPAAVAQPLDTADLALLATWAAATGTPLTARAAGTGMPGGNIGAGVVVDLRAFDRPLRIGLDQRATVGAAITWKELNDTAAHFGFRLPPDPSSGPWCTIGGMVATNAAGARTLKYGSIRRWVQGLELVTTDGDVFWLRRGQSTTPVPAVIERLTHAGIAPTTEGFPATTKNSAGYAVDHWARSGDVLDLLVGSEGTLAFITRVELALDRTPDVVTSRLIPVATIEDLAVVLPALLALDPAAIEMLDRTFLDLVPSPLAPPDAAAVLVVDFERAWPAEVDGVAVDAHALWDLRHGASPALARLDGGLQSLQIIEDGCVPVSALPDYLRGAHAAAHATDIRVVAFGHAGDGHLHVNALVDLDAPGIVERLAQLRETVTGLVIRLGGTPSGEHGDGRLRADTMERLYGSGMVTTFRSIKRAFDPAGVMNPGVILPDGPLPPFKRGIWAPV